MKQLLVNLFRSGERRLRSGDRHDDDYDDDVVT